MVVSSFAGTSKMPSPFLFFVLVALGCVVYNFIAGYVGGIEIRLGGARKGSAGQ